MPPKTIFGEYDIRGEYGKNLNKDVVKKIARGLMKIFGTHPTLVIGHDVRKSSPEIYKTIIAGAPYARFIKAGLATTPMMYFLVNTYGADGGIMVTASHNPKEYNGLKVVAQGAMPISGKIIEKAVKS